MKKVFSIACSIVILFTVLLSLAACGTSIQDEWGMVVLGEHLPTPQEGKLDSGSNLDDIFMGSIENVKATYFTAYKNACIEMGYTIESEESGNSYDAFNAEGYDLSLSYYSDEIHITLKAPVQLTEIEWPTMGPGAKIPAPTSTVGKVTSDTSNSFVITVGNTTIDGYNDYVKMCEERGFVVDYTKSDETYAAKDAEGYRLNVRYVGFNRIEITIQTPSQENSTTVPETLTPSEDVPETSTPTDGTLQNDDALGLRKEFKEAMDRYEQFMDEYVAFMKKYSDNPTDMGLLSDYATYMSKYAEFIEDFEKWDSEEMNAAESAYYIEVQARVSKKLLEVAQ